MDLTVFNKYQEYQSDTQKEFNPALRADNHDEPDLHLIGESVSSPSVISDIGDTATVGNSPFPAREDHAHAYTEYELPLGFSVTDLTNSIAGTAGTSDNVSREDHRHGMPTRFGANAGSTSAPAFHSLVNTNSGLYFSGADPALVRSGTIKIRGTSSGVSTEGNLNVGNGVTANTITARSGFGINSGGGAYLSGGANSVVATDHYGTNYWGSKLESGTDLILRAPSNYIRNIDWTKLNAPSGSYAPLNINVSTGIVYTNFSKRELKEKIQSVKPEYSGDIVDKLNPVSFIFKKQYPGTRETEKWRKGDLKYGFIAEEIAEVDEKLAIWDHTRDENGEPDNSGSMVPAAYNETSLLSIAYAELKSLRKRVSTLEEQLQGKVALDAK